IIYRPQVPAISIAAGLLETYEPVEIIGEVKTVEKQESREYVPREIQELADKIRNRASVYVVIRKSKPETEEDTEGDK
ncbi:MAG: hypothetical protein QXF65_02130, partial [Candidatus Korarchaeota archaeon]